MSNEKPREARLPLFDVSVTNYEPLAPVFEGRLPDGRSYSTESALVTLSSREGEDGELFERGTAGYVARSSLQPYEKRGDRPLIFGWNGGPLSPATTGIDVQMIGPNAIRHDDNVPNDVFEVEDNPGTPLKWADTVSIDPVGTGIARPLPWHDETHFYGVQRDVDEATALVNWHMSRGRYQESGTPLILAGSSYAAFRMTGVALALHQRGIDVAGLAFLSGHYDYSLQDYNPEGDPKPYALRLPAMALAAQAHGKLDHPYQHMPYDSLYREVSEFARGRFMEIAHHLGHASLHQRQETVETVAAYTGLSEAVVDILKLRIHPHIFRKILLAEEGMELSAVDGRLAFESGDVKIDPALDKWEPAYLKAMAKHPETFPYIDENYKGVILASQEWEFSGPWKKQRAHEVMEKLLTTLPDLQILHAAGAYDFINPPACAEEFWADMSKKTGIPVNSQIAGQTTQLYRSEPGVDIPIFPAGHAIGADPRARPMLATALRALGQAVIRRKSAS